LLGEHKPGKPLFGYLNGYGGKVEAGESILEAAERELREEIQIPLERPVYIGSIIHQEKKVFFYVSETEKREFQDTGEMINNNWYDLTDTAFVSRMLPGDAEIIDYLRENIHNYFEGQELKEFRIVKSGHEIDDAVQKLNKSIGHE
jgi:8-oxo-dGTP pyrophosphatase MutT (NUDIX family)